MNEIESANLAGREARAGLNWCAFPVFLKGVFLEGPDFAFVVLTFGTSHEHESRRMLARLIETYPPSSTL